MADKSGIGPHAVSLPGGNGNVAGLGEQFKVDLNTGMLSYDVPLDLPKGIAGLAPSLRLVYHHGASNGPFGLGWNLPLMFLSRRVDPGVPDYRDPDSRILFAGERPLVQLPDGSFRVSVENRFFRFRRQDGGWMVTEANGTRHECGLSPQARLEVPGASGLVFRWAVERTLDTSGNEIRYRYAKDGESLYLDTVEYSIFRLRFLYEPRPDAVTNGRAGFLSCIRLRCRSIELSVDQGAGPEVVRVWSLEYTNDPFSQVSLLSRLTLTGRGPASDGSGDRSLPALQFEYAGFEPGRARFRRFSTADSFPGPVGLDQKDTDLLDLDGEGLPGVIRMRGGKSWYWPNEGELRWGPPVPLRRSPAGVGLQDPRVRFIDADADGRADLVSGISRMSGYYRNDGRRGWDTFVKYRQAPAVSWLSPSLRLADVDGDGVIDALQSTSRSFILFYNQREGGWSEPQLVCRVADPERFPAVRFDDPWVRLADMNGDGLADIVAIRSGRLEYWPSLGHGRFGPRVILTPEGGERFPVWTGPGRIILADVNGDGLADLVYLDFNQVHLWVNQSGSGLSRRATIPFVPPIPGASVRPADMTGQGTLGLVWSPTRARRSAYGYAYLDLTGGVRPYLLTTVSNNMGLTTHVEYRSSSEFAAEDRRAGQPWPTRVPFGLPLVARVTQTDVVRQTDKVIEYRYHDGHFDGRARKFEGFARVEQVERGDPSRPDRRSLYFYHVGEDRLRGADYAALNRCLYRLESYAEDGSPCQNLPFRVEETEYDVRVLHGPDDPEQRVVFPFLRETRVTVTDRSAEVRTERHRFRYDDFGNVVEDEHTGGGTAGGVDRGVIGYRTRVEYARNEASWVLNLPARIIKEDLAGQILEETRRYYDGPDFVGLPLGQVGRGLLTREEKVVMTQDEFNSLYGGAADPLALGYHAVNDAAGVPCWAVNVQRYLYDARGNRVAERDPMGGEITTTFDAFDLYPREKRNTLGHTTAMTYDYRSQQIRTLTDANGAVTTFAYDALGRCTQVYFPGDSPGLPSRSYEYLTDTLPLGRVTIYRQQAGGAATAEIVEYQDGFARPLQKRTSHEVRWIVEGPALVNPWGQEREGYPPRFGLGRDYEAPPPAPADPRRSVRYDGIGRPVETINFDGAVSRGEYHTFEVRLTDPRGSLRIERMDAWQRLVGVEEQLGSTPVPTSIALDPLGRLREIRDPLGGLAQSIAYNRVGWRVGLQHRDAGMRTAAYDARGRVAWTRDGRGQEMRLGYDALGRIITLTANGALQEQYHYDAGAGANLVGRLSRAVDGSGERIFSYDSRGNTVGRTHTLPGRPEKYSFSFDYDAMGRQTRITYPDGAAVAFGHYDNHLVRRIGGVLDDVEYNAAQKVIRQTFANGVVTDYTYDISLILPIEIRTALPAADPYFHRLYTYDAGKNLTAIQDLAPGNGGQPNTQTLAYDSLNRLLEATGVDANGAYRHTYEYDLLGNILRMGDAGDREQRYAAGGTTTLLEQLIDGGGAPFAVTSDGNGCITALPGRALEWNYKGQLSRVVRSDGMVVEFIYDCQGFRVGKRVIPAGGPATETWNLGDSYEISGAGHTRFVHLGRVRVAESSPGGTRFLHPDHLGSVAVYTDQAGKRITRQEYYPYGAANRDEGTPSLQRFSGQTLDPETGFYYLHARYYAPELGRFLSPDPWILFRPESALAVPQALNLYAYVANSPSNYIDPNGLFFWFIIAAIAIVVVAAAAGAIIVGATQGWDQAWRGALIGLNAALNFIFGWLLFGPVVGGILGVITFLGVFEDIAKSDIYQGILGWTSWFMPMSWPIHAIGAIAFVLNVLGYLILWAIPEGFGRIFGQHGWGIDFFQITDMGIDWRHGTIYTVGGWVGNVNAWDTAFNLGGFTYVDNNWAGSGLSFDDLIEHESGHALSLGAFGWVFHLVGWVDEMVRGGDVPAERMADSNIDPVPGTAIPQWG